MDITSLLSGVDVQNIFDTLLLIAGGSTGLWFFTEVLKRAQNFPWFNKGDTAQIRAFVTIVGALYAIMAAWASGTLDAITLQNSVQTVIMAVGVIAGAHFTHKTISK